MLVILLLLNDRLFPSLPNVQGQKALLRLWLTPVQPSSSMAASWWVGCLGSPPDIP